MALENKKLSTYLPLASVDIDSTTNLVALSGSTLVNKNIPLTNLVEDTLVSDSIYKPLSAKQGKALKTLVDGKMSLTGVNTVSGDNTFSGFTGFNSAINTQSDVTFNSPANAQIVKVTGSTKVVDMSLASSVLVPTPTLSTQACPYGIVDDRIPAPSSLTLNKYLRSNDDGTSSWDSDVAPLASPTFTGTPSLPTGTISVKQSLGDNTTKIATTSFVYDGLAIKADKYYVTTIAVNGYDILATDDIVVYNVDGSGNFNLPTTYSVTPGREVIIKNIGNNTLTVTPFSGQKIDTGSSPVSVLTLQSLRLVLIDNTIGWVTI